MLKESSYPAVGGALAVITVSDLWACIGRGGPV